MTNHCFARSRTASFAELCEHVATDAARKADTTAIAMDHAAVTARKYEERHQSGAKSLFRK